MTLCRHLLLFALSTADAQMLCDKIHSSSYHIYEIKSLDWLQQRIVSQRHDNLAVKRGYVELKKLHRLLRKEINVERNTDVQRRIRIPS